MSVTSSTISELAHRAGISRQAMAQQVAELESQGYLELGPHPTDGRAKVVTYTEHGNRLAEDAFACVEDVEEEMTRKIGKRKMEALRSLLEELLDDTPEMEHERALWFRGF